MSHANTARRFTALVCSATLATLLAACGGGGDDDPSAREQAQAVAPKAEVALTSAATDVVLTGDSRWNLSKSGTLSGNTVTWTVEVARAPTIDGRLGIQGQMTVTNTGSGAAPIGNIVVNLQRRVGTKWVTAASDIADATQGDDATSANVHAAASSEGRSSFSENSASGMLNFMDAANNTVFSLVPQPVIGAGQSKTLLFTAVFDNNDTALQLTPGTPIRAEVIVSFGNAALKGNGADSVDINGNGTIDADEARVRSVPARLALTVPQPTSGTGNVVLTDTLEDITATGDVQFTNVQFSLGATGGTVTATVSGGANGGSITNCAYLRSDEQTTSVGGYSFPVSAGVDLQACSTVEVAGSPPSCTPGAPGCGWKTGEMRTVNQSGWETGTPASFLVANFSSLYSDGLVVGGTHTMAFTNATAVATYLPSAGSPNALNTSVINPMTTSSGELGGQIVALQLNTDLSSAFGNDVGFGGLRICGFAPAPSVNNLTVDEFLLSANWLLGGGSAAFGASTALAVANLLNNAFVDGAPSTFAQANLVAGPCPANWTAGQMRTFTQNSYGDGTSTGGSVLSANFGNLYGATNLVVGGANTMRFTSSTAVITYLPASGIPASLSGSLTNPLSSSSGDLGGQVVALQLNVDFSGSGAISGVVDLGSLYICNYASTPTVNGQTVDQFLTTANWLLGGGSAPFGPGAATTIANLLNNAFVDGAPSTFAQNSLFAGPCP